MSLGLELFHEENNSLTEVDIANHKVGNVEWQQNNGFKQHSIQTQLPVEES